MRTGEYIIKEKNMMYLYEQYDTDEKLYFYTYSIFRNNWITHKFESSKWQKRNIILDEMFKYWKNNVLLELKINKQLDIFHEQPDKHRKNKRIS
jgi:hypothetical protein